MSAVETYIRAWQERDPDVRARLLEQCFAADGRPAISTTPVGSRRS